MAGVGPMQWGMLNAVGLRAACGRGERDARTHARVAAAGRTEAGTQAGARVPAARAGACVRRAVLSLLAACVTAAAAGGVAGPALGAEPGVVLTDPTQAQAADMTSLGTHWVRVFATWPDLEPARGVFAQNWLAYYDELFAELPAGTKVIVDVVDSPSWETGSGDEHMPPANPDEYAAFVGALAQHWGPRVAAYESGTRRTPRAGGRGHRTRRSMRRC